jgi:hypothetical protein
VLFGVVVPSEEKTEPPVNRKKRKVAAVFRLFRLSRSVSYLSSHPNNAIADFQTPLK